MKRWVAIGLLAMIYLGAAIGTVRNHTLNVVDDQEQIREGVKHFRKPSSLLEPDYAGRKQLTATLFLGILHLFFGMRPFPYHLSLLVVHMFIFLLVIQLGRKIGLRGLGAGSGGLFFLILSLHFQAVTWMGNTTRVLMTLFILIAFLFFDGFRRTGRAVQLGGCWLSWFLALQSSPDAVVFPLLLIGYDLVMLKNNLFSKKNLKLLAGHLLMLAFSALYLGALLTFYAGLKYVSAVAHGNFQWAKRIVGVLWALTHLFVPRREALQYVTTPTPLNRFLIPLVLFSPFLWLIYRSRSLFLKERNFLRLSLFCFFWFVTTFLPFSVLERPFGWTEFPPARYFYVPVIGLSMWVGKVAEILLKSIASFKSAFTRSAALTWVAVAAIYFYALNVWTFCFMANKLDQTWSLSQNESG